MSLISKSTIQEVNDRLDALAVVEEYVHLEKRSGRYWGRCPFHAGGQEKTPSFTVDPDKKMYHCFGCNKGGGIIGFVMEMDKITYPEAIKNLAHKLGIEIGYEDGGAESHEDTAAEARKEALFELYRRMAGTFQHFFTEKPEGRPAFEYIIARGISKEMIERFRLGYSPADRNWMYRFLGQKGYSEEFLDSSGLFSSRYKGMPLFSGRLMFPISDRQGRVVAFGGRALPGAPVLGGREAPKYINSPELETYKKGQTLFAIDLALPEIRRTKEVYIAEGYMDVIALHQGGISNAVAPLGTAFTEDQAKLLRRWAERVVLVFDSDKAGQEAAYKGILTCRRNGLSCVLAVPGTGLEDQEAALKQEGGVEAQNLKDPADILKNLGSEALHKSMKCFINDFEYLISRGRSQYDVSTPVGKNRALALLFPYLELLDSEIERDDCIGAAADALRVDRTAVLDDYKRRHTGGTAAREEVPKSGAPVQMNAELRLLTAVSVNQNLYPVFRTELEIKEIEDPAAKELFVALEECFIHEENGMEALLTRLSSESLRNYIADRGVSREFTNNPGQFIADGVKMVKTKRKFERRSSEIMAKIREMERNSDSLSDNSSLEDLLSEKMHIDAEIRKLEGR